MTLVQVGRFVFPEQAATARRFLRENLLSVHGRAERLRAIFAEPQLRESAASEAAVADACDVLPELLEGEWLLLRDYEASARRRSVVFSFEDGALRRVAKLRPRSSGGESLAREAASLQAAVRSLPAVLAASVPRLLEHRVDERHEVILTTAVAGRSLSIRMQRSLRPVTTCARLLAAAGAWLGAAHRGAEEAGQTLVHGDFWPRNILFDDRGAVSGVVDWEHGSEGGDKWSDVFMLPVTYVLDAPRWMAGEELADFQTAFAQRSMEAEVIARYFRAYAAAADVRLETLRRHFEEFLTRRAAVGGKEERWQGQHSWSAMLELIRASNRSVFSG